MNQEDQINWDSYLIPGTEILKNKLGITNQDELKKAEKSIVRETLAYLYLNPMQGNFDKSHLLKIHEFIFGNIYPFAGKIRTCTLQKDIHVFCEPDKIEEYLEKTLKEMNEEFDNNEIYSTQDFAFRLGKYYYELLYIHPFREGNGRSIRTFFRDFVVNKSKNKLCGQLDLDYTKLDRENLMKGTAHRYIFPSAVEIEFMKGLVPNQNKNNKKVY